MELAQYYLPERVSAADDIYANVIGTALGALVGVLAAGNFRWLPFRQLAADRVPAFLLALWLGYRLYPYVPTIDLHKYWEALKPVILYPSPVAYDLFRYTAIWLTIGNLIEAIAGSQLRHAGRPVILCRDVGRQDRDPRQDAERRGNRGRDRRSGRLAAPGGQRRDTASGALTALLLSAYIVAERLAPFHFTPYRRAFGWVPFHSFLYGSLE